MKKTLHATCNLRVIGTLLIFTMYSGIAYSENALVGMRAYVQDGFEFLRLDFAQPVQNAPRGFTLQSPPRITLELPGVDNQLPQSKWNFSAGKLESAQFFVAGERARMVMNLKQNAGYVSSAQGNTILIRLQADTPPDPAVQVSSVQAPPANVVPTAPTLPVLQDIDFKRGPQGAGVVQV